MRRSNVYWFAGLLLLSGCKENVSGSYVASDQGAVCWLQLVQTSDDHLTGQIASSILGSNGDIEHKSIPLTGVVNGENIMLTGGGFLGMATTNLSGTFNGDTVMFSVQGTPLLLKRASLSDYQAKLGEQTTRAKEIISARAKAATRQRTLQAQKNFVAVVDLLIRRMQQFDAEADIHLRRFPNAEKVYEAITAKVDEYVTRERGLVGNPNRSVDRSQLDVAATQASLNTDQLHFQEQSLQSSLETTIAPLANQVTALEEECRQSGPVGSNFTATEIEERQSACDRLLSAAPTFHQKYVATAAGLNHLEEVYKREKNAQAGLLAAAERMN